MKNTFKILLTLLITFNLWGCGSKSEENYLYIDGSKDIEYTTLSGDKVVDTKYYKIELLETPKIQNVRPEVSNHANFMEARLVASPVEI